jgi:hypothetical protein
MPLFNVAVREHTYTSAPEAEAAGRTRCADVWVYALLHCEREAGHDLPHRALAQGYRRPVWWESDDLGIARAVPAPVPAIPRPASRGSL